MRPSRLCFSMSLFDLAALSMSSKPPSVPPLGMVKLIGWFISARTSWVSGSVPVDGNCCATLALYRLPSPSEPTQPFAYVSLLLAAVAGL